MLFATSAGFLTGSSLIIVIGAQNFFVLRQGLQRSHVGLVVGVCALSDIALILCGIAGAGILLREWPQLLETLRFGAAAFLGSYGLLAAQRAWRAGGAVAPEPSHKKPDRRRVLLACLGFTFLNPQVYLDTIVLIGGLSTHYPGMARWAFALGACAASALWFPALGFGARLLQPVFRSAVAWRVLDGGIAVFMLALCTLLLLRPLS